MAYLPANFANREDDKIRKSILRNAVRLQKLKGSKLAIRELFEIFGFTVKLINLWYTADGQRFHGPDEILPPEYADQKITTKNVFRVDPLIADYSENGFGKVKVPLVFRPLDEIKLVGYIVDDGSDAESDLETIVNNLNNPLHYEDEDISLTLYADDVLAPLTGDALVGSSEITTDIANNVTEETHVNERVLNINSMSYDIDTNILSFNFDHYLDLKDKKVYVLAIYEREEIVVPDALKDLQSNRFDISITFKDGSDLFPQNAFTFLLDQIYKLKAFHSLLRKLAFNLDLCDVYNALDFCLGGEQKQDPELDAGKLQVPGAIIPNDPIDPDACDIDSDFDLGYKPEDLALRVKIIEGLEAEHQAWKEEDSRTLPDDISGLEALSNLPIRVPSDDDECKYNQYGQDRVESDPDLDVDHEEDERDKVCDLEPPTPDYCYKGRVEDASEEPRLMALLTEIVRCKPCSMGLGRGIYYTIPYAGEDPDATIPEYIVARCPVHTQSMEKLFCDYRNPPDGSLHYSDRESITQKMLDGRELKALIRPSLEIEKESLNLPGHRFATMNKLASDFTHATWRKRPWDYDITCDFNPREENPTKRSSCYWD